MSRVIRLQKNSFYHIYNRGYNKQPLFFEQRDYEKFMFNLQKYQKKYVSINLYAFCVLPNHFHFILNEVSEDLDFGREDEVDQMSTFMQQVQHSYAMYFNAKHGGRIKKDQKMPVYEGRFQAKVIENEVYLEQLKIYVEWNAVKHGLVKHAKEWKYSSYNEGDLNINLKTFESFFEE